MLDVARDGPLWLKCPQIAAIVAYAREQGERHAWLIMPNPVHVAKRRFRPSPVVRAAEVAVSKPSL